MVIIENPTEIITVNDLMPSTAAEVPSAVPAAVPDGGIDKIESWIKILDKGLSLADRGITILARADSIVRNVTDTVKQQQQQQQQQPIIYQVQQAPEAVPSTAAEAVPAGGQQLVTAERICSVLDMLLRQAPEMTVKQLKELIERNPDTINNLLKFIN